MNNLLSRRVHGNIKPANILIDKHGKIKLSDFWLKRDLRGHSLLSTDTSGTHRYYSPEVINNEDQSEKSDVWSLGVVLLELAYGRDDYKDSEIVRMKSKKIKKEFKEKGGYSSEMAKFLSKCFERESTERATVEELLRHKWLEEVDLNRVVPMIKAGNDN